MNEDAKRTILVIEDEPVLRATLNRYLSRSGYAAHGCHNGKEAMEVLDAETVDLVITDINMPDMDGIEVVLSLRERDDPIPVIAISGGGLMDKRVLLDSAKQPGAVLTLEKPFDFAELGAAIEQILAGPR